jgi:hypothetical protein
MKKSTFSSLFFAGIFAAMPIILSANPIELPNDNFSDSRALQPIIKSLQASINYPQFAVQRNIQGKFTMLVNVDATGKVANVSFEVTSEEAAEHLSPLMQTVEAKLYTVNFGQEFAGQIVRIPFNFRLY